MHLVAEHQHFAVEPRPTLAVEPAPGGGHAGPASTAPAAAPLSGRRGASKRSRFTGHEKVDLVKRAIKDIDSGMGQRAVAHRLTPQPEHVEQVGPRVQEW